MAERARRRPRTVSIQSPEELAGGARTYGAVRANALGEVDAFCKRYGMEPARFMASRGWLDTGRWREGANWRECVKWPEFNRLIFCNIRPGKSGLSPEALRQSLEEERARQSMAGREVRIPAPARQTTFVYSVRIGMLGHETTYTLVSSAQVGGPQDLIRMLRGQPAGMRVARQEGDREVRLGAGELRRLADEIAARINDPLGVVLMVRVEIGARLRPGT